MTDEIATLMPIKAVPFEHQKEAFAFAMELFGVLDESCDSSSYKKEVMHMTPFSKSGKGCALLMEM